jgi:methyltransferase-like protein
MLSMARAHMAKIKGMNTLSRKISTKCHKGSLANSVVCAESNKGRTMWQSMEFYFWNVNISKHSNERLKDKPATYLTHFFNKVNLSNMEGCHYLTKKSMQKLPNVVLIANVCIK